jgi:hypothetical protein
MHMPKTFLVIGTVTVGFLTLLAVAKDTPEDAKLRAALRERMAKIDEAPAKAVIPATTAVVEPAAIIASSSPTPSFVTAPVGQDDPETAGLRDALRARMEKEGPSQEPLVAVTAPVGQDDPETAKLRDALHARMGKEGTSQEPVLAVTLPVGKDTPDIAKLRDALHARMEKVRLYANTKSARPNESEYVPLVAPPLPISEIKQQRLQQLLAQYKADWITPQEYHIQRATIIGE